jgi:hypothetical protein
MITMIGFRGVTTPKNLLRGIEPTFEYFETTPPTDLDKATDGDLTTHTGTGSKTTTGPATLGTFIFDLGSVKTVLAGCYVGLWSDSGLISYYIDSSINGTEWINGTNFGYNGTLTSESIRDGTPSMCVGRYIRFRFKISAAGTGNVRLYNAMAYELGV